MPPGRKPTRSREEFIEAALAYADAHGLEALTLKALGDALGASTTAVYRYFADKSDLIVALREHLLTDLVAGLQSSSLDPYDLLVTGALAFRRSVREHPCLGQIMTLPAFEGSNTAAVPGLIVDALARLGLSGPALVRGYQQIESYVVGSSAFDFGSAPEHLSTRRTRLASGGGAFAELLGQDSDVADNNEAAFEASLRAILDSIVAEHARAAG
mgnify:CR=1 FL=1